MLLHECVVNPLVSIILPVYNRPEVVKTINSILEQTYSNFELLIIDNASTDETIQMIKRIDDERIKIYINEVNHGQTFSLNRGISLAQGKYIARIDSDDLMIPTRLEKQVSYMESNLECIICGSNVELIDDVGVTIGKYSYCNDDDNIRFFSTFMCPFAHPAVLLRAESIKKYKLYYDLNYRMAEDYDMWVRILQYGKGHNIQENLTKYRQGKNNDSAIYHDQMKKEGFMVMRYIADNCKWSNYNREQYLELINYAEKKNKSIFEIVVTITKWLIYFRDNRKDCLDNRIIKESLVGFLKNTCLVDNERVVVRTIYKLLQRIKHFKRYMERTKFGTN